MTIINGLSWNWYREHREEKLADASQLFDQITVPRREVPVVIPVVALVRTADAVSAGMPTVDTYRKTSRSGDYATTRLRDLATGLTTAAGRLRLDDWTDDCGWTTRTGGLTAGWVIASTWPLRASASG
jgi:hypothetical protein